MAHSRGVTEPNMETPALHNARLAMQVEIGGTRGEETNKKLTKRSDTTCWDDVIGSRGHSSFLVPG